jgi:ribonucleoside-diphosphate reductase alpha chain
MAVSVEKKPRKKTAAAKPKLEIKRHFFKNDEPEASPYDTVEWGIRDAIAGDFKQLGVEAPVEWSDSAVGIVAKLYFATINGKRESSVRTLIQRVVKKITDEGIKHGYFNDSKELDYERSALIFENELVYILLHQIAAFNTPIWINLGVPGRKQCCSACYLLNVEDTMFGDDSITEWWCNEAKIFKSGAGSGVNLSKIRGSMEKISHGGIASGPVSFMRPADANAGTVKSGSVARRAAKLVCLDIDHPDILDFIDSKVREDERMRALMAAGFNLDPSTSEGEKNIAECTSFQNANISVRLSDEFMNAVENNEEWYLVHRKDKEKRTRYKAREILYYIAEAAWKCADPGVMFDDTINSWHTTSSIGRINTSNPCCEVHQNDNTSCNLASMNLVKFLNDDGSFRFDDFYHTVDIMITAMDITCSFSELPTRKLEENTRNLRQLGLGYSNLGAALMIQGMPYDSDEGRDWAASVTSLMTGRAYRRSVELASVLGSFEHYKDNEEAMGDVIQKHMNSCQPGIIIAGEKSSIETNKIWHKALEQWDIEEKLLEEIYVAGNHDIGFRNSQVTVIAPTGTISFMMDCDTTGAEPLFAPITYKKLASGGMMEQVPKCYKIAYSKCVNPEDGSYPKLLQTATGNNPIPYQGHLNMVAAIQPHISGAISKTVNLPNDVTVDDIYDIYIGAWQQGLKCVSVYRDGSKATQVLSTKEDIKEQCNMAVYSAPEFSDIKCVLEKGHEGKHRPGPYIRSPDEKNSSVLQSASLGMSEKKKKEYIDKSIEIYESNQQALKEYPTGVLPNENYEEKKSQELESIKKSVENLKSSTGNRRRMDNERKSLTHKFQIGQHEGYVTAGMYEDGTLGEIFLSGIGKEGSTLRGMMDAWAIAVSMCLQHGVPLQTLAEKFSHMRFDPAGFTNNSEIRTAHSMPDYIMRWLISKFGDEESKKEFGIVMSEPFLNGNDETKSGKICVCGTLMMRSGTCYTCPSCGLNTGCG